MKTLLVQTSSCSMKRKVVFRTNTGNSYQKLKWRLKSVPLSKYLRQNMSRYGNEEASSTNVIMYHDKKGGIPNQHWEFVPRAEMETEISSLK